VHPVTPALSRTLPANARALGTAAGCDLRERAVLGTASASTLPSTVVLDSCISVCMLRAQRSRDFCGYLRCDAAFVSRSR
jgi:hypothetical protein